MARLITSSVCKLLTSEPCFDFSGEGENRPIHGFEARLGKYIQVAGNDEEMSR